MESKRIDCLGMGIIPLDYLVSIPRFPSLGGKVDATDLTVQGGGPIPNAMVGLTRLGFKTSIVAVVGDDMAGRESIIQIKAEGVGHRYIIVKKNQLSATAYGFIEPDGRRTIALHRDIFLNGRDVTPDAYPVPKILHLDGRDMEAAVKMAKWGQRVGATVTFDIGSVRNDVTAVLPYVDHLVVADAWALPYTGKRTVRTALSRLADKCDGTIVITEGIKGATGLEDGQYYHHPAYRVKAVDTTGAGDAFHVGYLMGLLEEEDLPMRLKLGNAVAALKCTVPGARAGMPKGSALNKFLKGRKRTYG